MSTIATLITETAQDHAARTIEHDPKRPGCILWTGGVDPGGYGRRVGGAYAHRYACEQAKGPIPSGLVLDHLCRVRHCVNPDHLEPVTNCENILRGVSPVAVNARRTHCKNGHEFTEANTYWRVQSDGTGLGRMCRRCNSIRVTRIKSKRRAAARAAQSGGEAA